ncbi:MAG TPA: hypothetical protein H9756_01230 [Candidatus Mediterraneibacter gallistercoris]|uniref:CARDB domain-containing protein n=1 Tax=Candidatus Mediterraneibacter gallistercoris TaxID=2838671 RepID=A0A9D2T241_9FIRM|nr:hypothetical protein [Candidatus Mediterraneibacter gallistercoris]
MKRWKRAGAMLLCMIFTISMLAPMGARAEEEKTQESKVINQITLSVGDEQKTPVYKAGEKAELKINVLNKGNMDAQNVSIAPVISSTDEWPFDMEKLNYEQSLGTISAGSQTTALWGGGDDKLTVRSDVTGKSYKLTFRLTYDDGEKIYEADRYVFVKTEAKKSTSDSGNSNNTGNGNNSGNGNNTGKDQVNNIGSGDGSGGSSGDGSAVSSGSDFYDGGVYNSEPVSTGGDAASTGDGSVPRVIVTGFDTDPGTVKAGSNFKLVIHLKNTSKKTAVTNMLFDLQAPASGTDEAAEAPAFLPVSGSSSIYLDKIPANGTKDISIDLNSRADLIQKPYSITMTMKYEDGNATQFEGESSLAIPVTQEARFEFSEIQIMPDTVAVYEEANITCNLYNLGRVKMYNVKAKFEGDAIEGEEQFIGNLESGATGTIDGIVTAVAESYDESNCKLVLTYEDDSGKEYSVEQPFTMTITSEMEPADMEMMTDIPEDTGSPVGLIVAVIVGVAAVAAVVTAVLLKRRKKKIQSSEEEELLDEVERFTEDERREP